MSHARQQRVAIYTRKSSEEGLEKEFNSLHAQREACEAYIISQRELGWKALPQAYDDGGLSGGSMERPALKRLLDDVAARRVDVIVVYKIDRLTRSLMDFAKIMATFDRHDVSFVSVTQQFNTSTSMGRLTLNMLLSFAQFEREVTAERIRDKFAASKARGMWMGGVIPIGYDVQDRKLVINQQEALAIRWLFDTYLELGSVPDLVEAAKAKGLCSKRRVYRDGKVLGGGPIQRSHLYVILTNPVYLGKTRHKGRIHQGQHEAIIEAEVFDEVQRRMQANASMHRKANTAGTTDAGRRRSMRDGPEGLAGHSQLQGTTDPDGRPHSRGLHLLTGLLFDETGDRLSPSHASKNGCRYRYYVSHRLLTKKRQDADAWRLPASALETIIVRQLTALLTDPVRLIDLSFGPGANNLSATLSADDTLAIRTASAQAASVLGKGSVDARRTLLRQLIARIVVSPQAIRIELDRHGLQTTILPSLPSAEATSQAEPVIIDVPMRLRRRGIEARLVLGTPALPTSRPDPALANLLADAHHLMERLTTGEHSSLPELAIATGRSATEISRVLPLAFLAPDIVRSILDGSQPVELTAQCLKRTKPIPQLWHRQRQRLGFTPAA